MTATAASDRMIFATVVGYAALLVCAWRIGAWLVDASGAAIPTDFVNVWAAGRLALDGAAAGAYDWTLHKRMEVLAVGHGFDSYFGWHYPPPFLLVAAPLALLPYTAAHLAWMAASAPLYAASVRLIAARRGAFLAALAFPAAFWNVALGQNGFLTAALLGAGLALLGRRPALAGVLIGLLSYKPQFGLLIPIALVAGGCWRAVGWATAAALALAAVSAAVFGVAAWTAFLGSLGPTTAAVLVRGEANFIELHSAFGLVRAAGGGVGLAWGAQGLLLAGLAVVVAWSWRRSRDADAKAALLAAASLAASPYVYVYDLVVLGVAIAFLARRGLTGVETGVVLGACASILIGPFTGLPLGVASIAGVGALAVGRLRAPTPLRRAPASCIQDASGTLQA